MDLMNTFISGISRTMYPLYSKNLFVDTELLLVHITLPISEGTNETRSGHPAVKKLSLIEEVLDVISLIGS